MMLAIAMLLTMLALAMSLLMGMLGMLKMMVRIMSKHVVCENVVGEKYACNGDGDHDDVDDNNDIDDYDDEVRKDGGRVPWR